MLQSCRFYVRTTFSNILTLLLRKMHVYICVCHLAWWWFHNTHTSQLSLQQINKGKLINLQMLECVVSAAHLLLVVYLAELWDVSGWNASWESSLTLYKTCIFWMVLLEIVLCNDFLKMIVEIRLYQIKGQVSLYFSAWLCVNTLYTGELCWLTQSRPATQLSTVKCPKPLCWLTTCVIVFSITV